MSGTASEEPATRLPPDGGDTRFHCRGDIVDKGPEAGPGGFAPKDERRKSLLEGEAGQDIDPVVGRADDLPVVGAETGFGHLGEFAGDVVDAPDCGGIAPRRAGGRVDDRVASRGLTRRNI